MQTARNRLTGMCAQEGINRRIQIVVPAGGQVTTQPCRDQIIVDGVLFERGRIRDIRLMQADALHRCHEFVADLIIFRSGLPNERLRRQRLHTGKHKCGAQQHPKLSRHAGIMVLELDSHEI